MYSSSSTEVYDIHIKLLLLGDSGVGKTSLVLRYSEDTYNPSLVSTMGIDFKTKNIVVEDLRTKLQIWDTAGQERFRAITTSYFKGSHAVMLVYDCSDRETFENIGKWTRQIRDHGDLNTNIILIGNKADDDTLRVVSKEEGSKFAEDNNVTFLEVSALLNIGVNEAFERVALETKRRLLGEDKVGEEKDKSSIKLNGVNVNVNKGSCCK